MTSPELVNALKLVFGPLKNILEMLSGKNHDTMMEILSLISRISLSRVLRALKAENASRWAMIDIVPFDREKFITFRENDDTTTGIPVHDRIMELFDSPDFQSPTEVNHFQFTCGTYQELFGHFTEIKPLKGLLNSDFLKRFGYALCEPSDALAIASYISKGSHSFNDDARAVLVGSPLIVSTRGNKSLFGFVTRSVLGMGIGKRINLEPFIPTDAFVGNVRWMFRRLRGHEISD